MMASERGDAPNRLSTVSPTVQVSIEYLGPLANLLAYLDTQPQHAARLQLAIQEREPLLRLVAAEVIRPIPFEGDGGVEIVITDYGREVMRECARLLPVGAGFARTTEDALTSLDVIGDAGSGLRRGPRHRAVRPPSPADVAPNARGPVRVFCSYSHKDERFRERLETELRLLSRERATLEWQDRMIRPGEEWREEIREQLNQAAVIILLVTPDFLASDFIHDEELLRALQRHERGDARVIPVIVRPCAWQRSPIARLQALPKDAKAITTWSNRDSAWTDVGEQLDRLIGDLQPKA